LRLINTLCLVVLTGFLLVSCAIDQAQNGSSIDFDNITVDSDVEQEFDRALVLLKAENYDAAIELLKGVIEKEKRLPAPYVNLGMAYDRKGDKKQAENAFMKALDLDLAHPQANNELGRLYRKQGRFDEARKAYTNALTRHADYLPIIRNLGILCDMYLQDLDCALEQFELYQKHLPDDKTVGVWVSDVKRRAGR